MNISIKKILILFFLFCLPLYFYSDSPDRGLSVAEVLNNSYISEVYIGIEKKDKVDYALMIDFQNDWTVKLTEEKGKEKDEKIFNNYRKNRYRI